MKYFFIMLILAAIAPNTYTSEGCHKSIEHSELRDMFPWGDKVNVEYHDEVTFFLATKEKLSLSNIEVIEYGGFECPAKDITIEKIGENCIAITSSWYPGSDSSSCDIFINNKGKRIGPSTLYMSY